MYYLRYWKALKVNITGTMSQYRLEKTASLHEYPQMECIFDMYICK